MSGSKSTKVSTKASKTKVKSDSSKKHPTAYNKFMQIEIPKVKTENPTIQHKDAFKLAAGRWKDSPENPKNAQ
ncbi:14639_t:CDS:2 [Ambispora leptoticha]|uniref:14639_t:CDS:1 n=1 Tax=Ambispora leptoticha TaxID=144679 RepID=A0A9N9BAR8_9GLOM|nr:14639_t:CDS:2 [Ambispora leptoticha]